MGYLTEWCEKYEVNRMNMTYQCEDLTTSTLGVTRYRRYQDERYADIRVHEALKDCPLSRMAVTWHEFCHAEKWLKEGKTDGHGSEWRKRMWREPLLAIWDVTGAVIVFNIVVRCKRPTWPRS